MARKIYSVEVQTEDGPQTFRYRKPSGALMLKQSDKFKSKDGLSNEQSTRDLYAECILSDDDQPIGADGASAILDMEWDVIQALNAVLMPPKDEQKNG
jgi:hypothetical protein